MKVIHQNIHFDQIASKETNFPTIEISAQYLHYNKIRLEGTPR